MRQVKSRRLPLGNQLRQPRVIGVAGQIPGLDPAMPEAWHHDCDRSRGNQEKFLPPESKREAECWSLAYLYFRRDARRVFI